MDSAAHVVLPQAESFSSILTKTKLLCTFSAIINHFMYISMTVIIYIGVPKLDRDALHDGLYINKHIHVHRLKGWG